MHIDWFLVGFAGFVYYMLAMVCGISLLEDMKDNILWKMKSTFFKFWYWLFFVFVFSQLVYTPFKFIAFVVSFNQHKKFFNIIKFHMGVSR